MSVKFIRLIITLAIVLTTVACGKTPTEIPPIKTDLRYLVSQERSQERNQVQLIGNPYDIAVNNCNGARDSIKIEERSVKHLTELDLEISSKVAAEFGGSIEVAKAVLRGEIGIALGVRIGRETTATSSVTIVTPPGKKTVTIVQWKEVWTKGTIEIMRPDGSYIDVLPFSVLNSLTLEQQDSQILDCETGKVETREVSVQIATPEIPQIIPTPTPVSVGTISVLGNSSEGTRFAVGQPGLYIFRYIRGAYSTYPVGAIPEGKATWLTALRIFKNRPVEWDGIAISDVSDYRAVDYAYFHSEHEAEAIAQGESLTLSLLRGDYLILVAVDEQPYYSDNPGEVIFEVLFIPQQ